MFLGDKTIEDLIGLRINLECHWVFSLGEEEIKENDLYETYCKKVIELNTVNREIERIYNKGIK